MIAVVGATVGADCSGDFYLTFVSCETIDGTEYVARRYYNVVIVVNAVR
jgi:hypothetical protein